MEISSEPIKGRDENDVQKTYDKLQGKVDDPVEFPPIRDADQIDLSTSKNEASCTGILFCTAGRKCNFSSRVYPLSSPRIYFHDVFCKSCYFSETF